MSTDKTEQPKPLFWVGSALNDLKELPATVRQMMGFAPFEAQKGGKHRDAKVLRGFGGAGVLEVVSDHEGDTFRCVYSVKFAGVVYALHDFQKKSKRGVKTPAEELEVVRRRLKVAEEEYAKRRRKKTKDRNETAIEASSGNVFEDLALAQPEELLAKAELVHRICDIIAERNLTQGQAAAVLGIDQPKVSALTRGKLDGFSIDRLFRFLNALGRDVEIVIRPARQDGHADTRIVSP